MPVAVIILLLGQVDPFAIASKKATPDIVKDIDRLNQIRQEACDHAVKYLGAKLPEKVKVVLELVDAADPDPALFKRHSGIAAETWSESDTVVKIRFFAEYFVNGLGRPESTL